MNCESYILLLDEYLNDELDENLRGSVSAHLDNCKFCREELRFLSIESGFYQKVSNFHEQNFTNQWDEMRERLISESLIKTNVLPKGKEVKNHSQFPFVSAFFVRLENLFLTNKPAFGIFLLVIAGIITLFFLSEGNTNVDDKYIAATDAYKNSKSENEAVLPEHNASQPDESIEKNELNFAGKPKTHSAEKTVHKSTIVVDKNKLGSAGKDNNSGKVKSKVKPSENKTNTNPISVISSLPVKNTDADSQAGKNDKKLVSYLNEVHLFLLMFRNLENDKTINAVIGDKYQTEAEMFLVSNNYYKKESLKNKNIPAAELLNEIEPVLKIITNLNEKREENNIGKATAMINQSGLVFKMRLWMSNAKSDNSL